MIYTGMIAAICGSEYILRKKANEKLKEHEKLELERVPFTLTLLHNSGMAGGRLKHKPEQVKAAGISAISALAVCLTALKSVRGQFLLKTSLALILGGGLANLLERLRKGYVTDYVQLRVKIPRLKNMVFNAADFCVFAGGILLLAVGMRSPSRK